MNRATESRRSEFKKGVDAQEGRRRRTETTINLRKNKKVEGIAKRRAMTSTTVLAPTANNTTPACTDTSTKRYTVDDIPTLMAALQQPGINGRQLLEVVRAFRRILSVETNVPVTEVLECGALPAFVQMLEYDDSDVQFEAAWALTNIASTNKTSALVEVGAISGLVKLMSTSPHPTVREQCAWCLGNVSGDSAALRDVVLRAGAMEGLMKNIVNPANKSHLENCVWTLSNFCRHKNPQPDLRVVSQALPIIADLLSSDKLDDKSDPLWALSYISDGDDDNIKAVIDSGVLGTLINFLGGDLNSNLITPALRAVGNLVTGNDVSTDACLNAGLLNHMMRLLNHHRRNTRKEACWVLSNIAAGTQPQIQKTLTIKGGMSSVVDLSRNAEWEVRKEAIWVLSNIATGGSDNQVVFLVEIGAIEAFVEVLKVNDTKMLLVALEAIESILKVGEKKNTHYTTFIDECGGLELLEGLQEHDSTDIYEKTLEIIETYFGADDLEDENLAPQLDGNTFSFGVSTKNGGTEEVPTFDFGNVHDQNMLGV